MSQALTRQLTDSQAFLLFDIGFKYAICAYVLTYDNYGGGYTSTA